MKAQAHERNKSITQASDKRVWLNFHIFSFLSVCNMVWRKRRKKNRKRERKIEVDVREHAPTEKNPPNKKKKKKKWPGYFHEGTNRMDGWIVDGGRTRVVTVTARWRAFWQATLDVAAHAPLVLVVVLDDDERRSCWPESRALYRAPESVWAELAELMDATSMMSKPNPRTKEDPASIWQPRFLIMEQTPTMVHRFG